VLGVWFRASIGKLFGGWTSAKGFGVLLTVKVGLVKYLLCFVRLGDKRGGATYRVLATG
jgi:hypothetical protein